MQRDRLIRRKSRLRAIKRNMRIVNLFGYSLRMDRVTDNHLPKWIWAGWDGYYSRRPFGYCGFGKEIKQATHRVERRKAKQEISQDV
jgi:hypothetical protein